MGGYEHILMDPFTYLAILAIIFSFLVVTMQNLLRATVMLAGAFTSLGGLYIYMGAAFVGTIQLLLYTSVVTGLMLFTIMLVKKDRKNVLIHESEASWKQWAPAILSVFVAILLFLMIASIAMTPMQFFKSGETLDLENQVAEIGRELLTTYVLPFELVSLLLFVAIIGAIVIARESDPKAEYKPGLDEGVTK